MRVRACVCACVRAYVRAFVRARASFCMFGGAFLFFVLFIVILAFTRSSPEVLQVMLNSSNNIFKHVQSALRRCPHIDAAVLAIFARRLLNDLLQGLGFGRKKK